MLRVDWWAIQGSNLELPGYEPGDLPIDLMARIGRFPCDYHTCKTALRIHHLIPQAVFHGHCHSL